MADLSRRVLPVGCLALAGSLAAAALVGPASPVHASTSFVPGTATATSQALQIAPHDAGLAATISVGTSIAQYRASLAQASSQALTSA